MKKVLTLLAAMLMTSFLAFAQEPAASTPATETSTNSTASSVQGCLGGSSGAYTLTDKNGMVLSLTGKTDALGQHVGHEVAVTGQKATAAANDNSASSTSPAGTSTSATTAASATFQVDDVRMVSEHCSADATSK